MFVLVSVACVVLAYQLNWIRQRHDALQSGRIEVLDDFNPFGAPPVAAHAPGLLWLIGEQGYPQLWLRVSREDLELTPAESLEMARFERLFPEANIGQSWTPPPLPQPAPLPKQESGSPYDGFKL